MIEGETNDIEAAAAAPPSRSRPSTSSALGVSPTAKAFFDALDITSNDNDNINNKNGCSKQCNKTTKQRRKISGKLLRQSQSLGWRNRHSQVEYYPVTISMILGDKNDEGDDGNNDKDTISAASASPTTESSSSIPFTVKQIQRGEIDNTYGTGATVWPAAMVLLKYMEYHARSLIHGKRVVDLGCGTGVTSIAAAILGATSVICTDGQDNVVTLAYDNVVHAAKEINDKDSNVCATTFPKEGTENI